MARVIAAVFLVAMTGCSSLFDIGNPALAPDAAVTSCPIGGYDLCASQEPAGAIAFSTATSVNTSLDCNVVLFDPQGGSSCVIYATEISVAVSLVASGPRPLVLAATGSIQVDGTIDVSSYHMMTSGAGTDSVGCIAVTPAGTDSGGGAGGSLGGKGGNGGNGTTGASSGGLASAAISPPAFPRGGCAGGRGAGAFQEPGNGGGSVWLVAGGSITLSSTGQVLAGGAGGVVELQDPTAGGGSGGGSGGFIRIAAPTVAIAGLVEANGGGGGEGGATGCSMTGNGSDSELGVQPAPGGSGCTGGGDGGAGAAATVLAGKSGVNGTIATSGGGGGGGGAGIIVIDSPSLDATGATISPPAL